MDRRPGMVEAVEQRLRQIRERVAPKYVPAAELAWPLEWNDAPAARAPAVAPPEPEGLQLIEADMQPVRCRQVWFMRCPLCGRMHHHADEPTGPTKCQRCRSWLLPAPAELAEARA